MQREDAVALLEKHEGCLVDASMSLIKHLPKVVSELESKVDITALKRFVPERQVESLNKFCFRYLTKFENTLEVRKSLSRQSPAADWLMDFHNEVVPKLQELD